MSENKCFILLVMLLFLPFIMGAGKQLPVAEVTDTKELIRLHVVANSDSTKDQNLKLKVRDEIISFMAPLLADVENREQAVRVLTLERENIIGVVRAVIQEEGFNYPINLYLGKQEFPTRLYGNRLYPSGEYHALMITIGEGSGRNWWCVLFPPLCFSVVSEGPVEIADNIADTGYSNAPKSYFSEVWRKMKAWITRLLSIRKVVFFN